nr:MAG TPA: hypothetical protein [Bacteriophage sp.]
MSKKYKKALSKKDKAIVRDILASLAKDDTPNLKQKAKQLIRALQLMA